MAFRFNNIDGAHAPQVPGWTIQETTPVVIGISDVANNKKRVTTTIDGAHTQANVGGWTVQNAATGSNQHTV